MKKYSECPCCKHIPRTGWSYQSLIKFSLCSDCYEESTRFCSRNATLEERLEKLKESGWEEEIFAEKSKKIVYKI